MRSRAASTTMLAAATAAVVVMAVTATGFPVNHVSANDGGVWLTNDNPGGGFRGTFGELNVPIRQLGYDFGDPGGAPQPTYNLDVLQDGTTVLAIDRGAGRVYPVDALTGSADVAAGVSLPPGGQIALGGGVAAVLQPATATAPGKVWAGIAGAGDTANLAAIDTAKVRPLASLPGAAALAVDSSGDVYVASRTELLTLDATPNGLGRPRISKLAAPLSSVALTTVGRTPVVLDAAERVVHFPETGLSVTLPVPAGTATSLRLQQSGPTSAAVLVASDTALLSVPLDGHMPTVLGRSSPGRPAAPVRLNGCDYAAWAGDPAHAAEACDNGLRVVGPLPGGSASTTGLSAPVFRVNHDEIVLNDAANGAAWSVAGRPVQDTTPHDWIRALVGSQSRNANAGHRGKATSNQQRKRQPKLYNPVLHARPGRDSVLHLLDHDVDPGGSILSIVSVSPASGPDFQVRVAPDTQTVILSLGAKAAAPITFTYDVVDGFGLTASGPVTVVPTTAEHPPYLLRKPPPARAVVSGGSVSEQVLGNWRDPENDPVSLVDASVPSVDGQVTWTSDGLITYDAASVARDTPVTISYAVTDGRSAPVHGQLHFDLLGANTQRIFPPTGVPDAVSVVVGQATPFAPLANDLFGADPTDPGATLGLAGTVASVPGLSVATDLTSGQLTLTASRPGAYSIRYRASFGSAVSAPTQILVLAAQPAGKAQPPVTSPVSLMLHGQYPATVNVLAADYDPAGGLLSVVGVSAPNDLQVTVVGGQYLRITAANSDPTRDQVVTYQVSDGRTAPATGQVTVLWAPAGPAQPPVAPPLYATVRAGQEVTVPVLAAATDPDGESVDLLTGGSPHAVQLAQTVGGPAYPTGLGAASLTGGNLVYAAPAPTGVTGSESVTASYVVESQLGDRTTGHVYLTVIPDDAASATAPQPPEVDARVTAGGTVTIPIPTTGVDPDGDAVTLVGVTSAPQLGRILSYNADSITYEAFPLAVGGGFSGGTDDFTYEVEGPTGLTAQGEVRVGVTPPGEAQPPVATDHYVTAAPGSRVEVDLLAGDYIAAGDHAVVEGLARTNAHLPPGAALVGPQHGVLEATAPRGATTTAIAYGLSDGTAAPSVADVFIRSQPGYTPAPTAVDYFPSPAAANAKYVVVDVLAHDSDPAGGRGGLRLVGSPTPGTRVMGSRLAIPVGPDARAVPYVIESAASGATAVGTVFVPATITAPHLVAGRTIHLPRDGHVTVDIRQYISDPGHQLRLTTANAVSAQPSGGLGEAVRSNTAVTLTGLAGYVGPGSLTVQVTDAASLSAAHAQTVTLSIPVMVGTPTPTVRCPASPIDVVQGGPVVTVAIASVCQVWTPNGAPGTSVHFTAKWAHAPPAVRLGWQAGHTGQVLVLSAGSRAKGGTAGTLDVGVPGGNTTAGSTLAIQVIAAPPPTAVPATPAPVRTGQTATVDMAQYVRSPLAHPRIYVVSVHQATGPTTPASSAGSVVRITPHTGTHGTLVYDVAVSDQGPGRPDRVVNDTITLQVLDRPSPPTGLQATAGNGQVTLSWQASAANGSPVERYVVESSAGTRQTTGTSYTWAGLVNGHSYSFRVSAVNQVGTSLPSSPITASPRAAPGAPSGVSASTQGTGAGAATVSWAPAQANGEPITEYLVSVRPAVSGPATRVVGGGQTSLAWTGLSDNAGPYTFTVVARNKVGDGPPSAPSKPVYAHGTPSTPGAPSATAQVSTDQVTTTVTVTWPAVASCNDDQPCVAYVLTELRNNARVTSIRDGAGAACSGSSCTQSFGPLTNDGSSYAYTVAAVNQEGQTSAPSPASTPVKAVGAPGQVTDLTASPGDTQIHLTFTLPASHASTIQDVQYTLTGGSSPVTGSWSSPGSSGQQVSEVIGGLVNGTTYSVTVTACNEAQKCGSPSNAASADPYGPPNPPSVAATGGTGSITFTWSGGGNNGRPVASYGVCIDGSCTTSASPGSKSVQYGCSTTHSVYAYVVDSVGQRSSNSPTVSASTQACAQPNPPSVSDSVNGNNVTWSWSGGGGNTLTFTYYLCVDGACSSKGSSPGSVTDSYSCGQQHSAYGYVVDSLGHQSGNSTTVMATTSTCPPPPTSPPPTSASRSISISWSGNPAPAGNWMSVTWTGFARGTYQYTCVGGGVSYGTYSVYISSSPYTATSNTCYDAQPGQTTYVTTDGVQSNSIASD